MSSLKFSAIIFLLIYYSSALFSQSIEEHNFKLTGNLHFDSKVLFNIYPVIDSIEVSLETPSKKNPLLAGLFSAIIPGAGQVYNNDWWIAGVFVAVEAALIATAVSYDNKGDDQTASFEAYADQYWSVVRYAEWLNNYEQATIAINPDESLPPWERVNWNELNAAETGSHNLPPHGEQQYYEVIGKYHQYSSGWNDYTGGANNDLISPNFTYYSGERGLANDYYNTASTAVIGIYVNHLLSAAEAVWGANRFNDNLTVSLRVQNTNLVYGSELVPTLMLKYNF
jgi:hypothetical protein